MRLTSARHSPAVSYPLHSAHVLQMVWGLLVAGAAAVLVMWWGLGAGHGVQLWLRIGCSTALWLLCALTGWRFLAQMPQGTLQWDGNAWMWVQPAHVEALQGSAVVTADLQWLLVLRFAGAAGGTRRFVVQRDWAPYLWLDLRRAVYSLAYPTQDAVKNRPL